MIHARLYAPLVFVALLHSGSVSFAQENDLPEPARNDQPTAPPTDPAEFQRQVSYSLGLSIGGDFKRNQIPIDVQSFATGVNDGLTGRAPRLTQEQMTAVMQRLQQQMRQRAAQQMQSAATKNQQAEKEFLAQNKQQEGVVETESGLQYKVLREGDGASPKLTDTVRAHYEGTLLDGTVFDSSYSRNEPLEVGVGEFVPGWKEALQLMQVGDKWKLYVPADLAFGMDPPPGSPIEPASMLIFDLELLDIVSQ